MHTCVPVRAHFLLCYALTRAEAARPRAVHDCFYPAYRELMQTLREEAGVSVDVERMLKKKPPKPKIGRPKKRLEKQVTTRPAVDNDVLVKDFCHNFLFGKGKVRYGVTEAYLAARPGISRGSANSLASKLLATDKVQRRLHALITDAFRRNELKEDDIIRGWIDMANANVMDYFDCDDEGILSQRNFDELPAHIQRNITQLDVSTDTREDGTKVQRVRVKIVDRKGVYDSMARAAQMFGDRKDLSDDLATLISEAAARVRESRPVLQGEVVK